MPDHRTRDLDPAQSPPERPEKLGTTLAINPPPLTNCELVVGRGLIANSVPSFAARRAERIFAAFVAATPPGARRQWRTRRALEPIFFLLHEGISEGDLLDHFAGAAELIRRGYQAPKWWSVANVLGPKTLERWRADIHDMRRADERAAVLQQRDEDERALIRDAPPPKVTDLNLQRLVRGAEVACREQWSDEQPEDAEHA